MVLDERLREIASMVGHGSLVADIGTDHGYLIAELVQSGVAVGGYACDINPMPLDKARSLIKNLGLQDKISCILCSGLSEVPHEVDTVVIAGMGGSLIAQIIDEAPWLKDNSKRLLLQPMTKPDLLRDYLAENGFDTDRENAVCCKRFAYTVFSVRYNGEKRKLSELERHIGKVIAGGTDDTIHYLNRVRGNLLRRGAGLRQSEQAVENPEKYFSMVADIDDIIKGGKWLERENC